MIVVLFRSKLVEQPDGYAEMAQEMVDTARTLEVAQVIRGRDFTRDADQRRSIENPPAPRAAM